MQALVELFDVSRPMTTMELQFMNGFSIEGQLTGP